MTRIFLLLGTTAFLVGCGSVADTIPTVKIEKRKPQTTVQSASFVLDEIPNEASMICENDEMRTKALDRNDDNDTARVMVVQDGSGGSRVLHDVEVNCRDYFLRKSVYPSQAKIIQSATPTREPDYAPRVKPYQRSRNLTYVVRRGDTVWDIARKYCTSVEAIARLNGLGRANVIDVGDRLELPETECD